jgi:predicted Zn-dependent protease
VGTARNILQTRLSHLGQTASAPALAVQPAPPARQELPLRSAPLAFALSFAVAVAFGLASPATHAQDTGLPDIGSSAEELLTPAEETEIGAYTLYQLRRYGYVLEDPLIDSWLSTVGHRLAAVSDRPEQGFRFFVLRDRQINAFATLGGYVGVNAGTVLAAEREDELAGVLAHEISHVTQRHVLRAVERAKKDQIPIMLATLGVILAAQRGGGERDDGRGNGKGDAIQAAVMAGQGLAAQRQIDYTRSVETEADRVGIQTLYNAGYDANGMGDFFERMERLTRGDSGGYQTPAYLQDHPVTTTRLSEARDRAQKLQRERPVVRSPNTRPSLLLPWGMTASSEIATARPAPMFDWARERLRVLTARTPEQALREAKAALADAGPKASDARRYAVALAQMKVGYPAAADAGLQVLATHHPDNAWVGLALAENAFVARNPELSKKRYEQMLAAHPDDRAVILSYAETLNAIGGAEAGRRAQGILRPLLADNADNPLFQANYARASELAGDTPRAGEAYAEAAWLNGRAEDALNQLTALLKRNDLAYIQRARIEARIAAITPEVLDMRRRKIRPQDLPADGS